MDNPKRFRLDSLCDFGRRLLRDTDDAAHTHYDFQQWDQDVAKWLDSDYPNTGFSAEWSALPTSSLVVGGQYYDQPETWIAFRSSVQKRLAWLGEFGRNRQLARLASDNSTRPTPNETKRVFIVHGRNERLQEKVARFVEKLGLEAVILHEQPNKGRTIIEKFIGHADVAYAVVLLTADDMGSLNGSTDLKPRARQNVIFELGYFFGRVGRDKVCALYEEGVEILSDYSGVLYVTLDANDAWKFKLAKEMKEAGLPIDLNRFI